MSPAQQNHDNGSFWFHSLERSAASAGVSELPASVDVAIIGGGYTGLWTAYYLKRANPSLSIAVFEAVTVGFGASGRNGGWCMGLAFGIESMLANPRLRQRGLDLLYAMHDTVDEVGRVCQAENIDCHYAKGGTITVATLPFTAANMRAHVEQMQSLGFTEEDYRWLNEAQARERFNCAQNHGAAYTKHCAAIHPARLAKGLGKAVTRLGVEIHEDTPVMEIGSGHIDTSRGRVDAEVILRATEGYSDSIPSQRRAMLPLYSMMVATEPLPPSLWDEIGLARRETFGDGRRVVIYGQRTEDGRLAFGGRAGYYFGSKRIPVIDPNDPNFTNVERSLRRLLPQLDGIKITHRWGGLMGVPRHWRPSVNFDARTGFGYAGGYTGEGVAAANLAGRILADLVCAKQTELTRLAWVGDVAGRWEPEPLRWLGAKSVEFFGDRADAAEFRTGRPAKFWGGLFNRFVG